MSVGINHRLLPSSTETVFKLQSPYRVNVKCIFSNRCQLIMMDQQRDMQNQQQQRSSHHRRPPDVEEALSSMLWTPYERTPTESSSDDDDERLNRKLRKSQSNNEYYHYGGGGLTLAPPAAIMPYFGSTDPITPFVPLSNHHHDSVRNNNNINNSSCNILSYSSASINNNSGRRGSATGTDYFRKTDRCDNFRFSYPYYGPIPSLSKCLSVEPPSYDSLYTKSKDATRVLSNLVTVSATPASGVLRAPGLDGDAIGSGSNESYGRMVHSFTDNFVIECNSSSSPSVSSSTSSTSSVAQTLHHQQYNTPAKYQYPNQQDASNITTNNHNDFPVPAPSSDVRTTNSDTRHRKQKRNEEQKQTEVNQLAPLLANPTQNHSQHYSSTAITAINKTITQQHENSTSPIMLKQQRKVEKERIAERSDLSESSEVSSLSTFVANGIGGIACRSLTVQTATTITTSITAVTTTVPKASLRVLNNIGAGGASPSTKSRHVQLAQINPVHRDSEIVLHDPCGRTRRSGGRRRCSRNSSSSSSGSAEDIVALAMRLNIPATTGTDAPASFENNNYRADVRNVSVTTSSVFLSNSMSADAHAKANNFNNNNNVAILSSNSAPSLTIQVNDNNNTANHGDFVVNQSIANNGISVVNCSYANSIGVGEGSVINSKSSSSSVPKSSSKFLTVNNNTNHNQTDTQCSTRTASAAIATSNGLQPEQQQQESSSPTRTFTSTECQTDDIPILIRSNVAATTVSGGNGGGLAGGTDGGNTVVRSPQHPDALLSREQRRRERRERRQQQQQQQQQMQHQRLNRHHSHSHPPPQQPPLLQHPAHHTMSAAAAAMLRPMLPDILHSHFPPPYSALPLSQGAPPPPPPQLPPHHAASLITPVISTVPITATTTMVGDGRFSIPLPIIRRSPSERSGKGCCGQWFAGPPLRALIAVVALGGVACALGGAALGATGLAGPPSSHLTAALLMIGVGVVLVTVSGAAWRLTAPGGPPCLGLGSSVDLGRCGRRPCSRGGGAPHGLLYPEFQHRPPPPSYQASMQEYRLRLLLLDRDRQNGVVRGSSPPPTYRSHTGSLLRAPLTTTIRGGASSEYSLPPSYRSRNATPVIISSERSIETTPSGRLLANEDIPESSLCTISSNLESSLPAYTAIIHENLHQPQPTRNSQQGSATSTDNHMHPKDNTTTTTPTKHNTETSESQKQITPSTLSDGHQSSSTAKEYPSPKSGDRTSLLLLQAGSNNDSARLREQQLLQLSEKLNPRVLANNNNSASSVGVCGVSNRSNTSLTTGKTKDLVTIVTISAAQDNTSSQQQQQASQSSSNSQGEMDILAHL